jgi:ABC-type sulfate transport system substrate-binding protein
LKFDPELRSVAGTSLAWGAFSDKQAAFNQEYGDLTWENVHAKAVTPNDFLTIVLASPSNRAEGLAALISAAAAQLNKQTLSSADISQARPWLTETFKDNTKFPPKPAEAFASTQGRSIGDVGLLSRASWQRVGLQNRPDDFTLTPPQPDVYLDYPLAIWTGSQATPAGQQTAAQFRDFLLSDSQQQALANFSLEPAGAAPPTSVQIDGPAAWALLRLAEQELTP